MKVIDIENIKLPSVNGKYGYNPKTNRFYLNNKYRLFKDQIEGIILKYSRDVRIMPPYSVRINVSTALDIDNYLKVLMDSLQAAQLIDDDKNILQLIINKTPLKRGQPNKLQVFISNIDEVKHG